MKVRTFDRMGLLMLTAPVSFAVSQPALGQVVDATIAEPEASLEEIVVTAQKRAENLQDVPIAVTAVTASTLEAQGALTTFALPSLVSGLVINHTSNEGNLFIRGVGTNLYGPSTEQTVAMFVDGVYYRSPEANLFDFNNIERIEVLKGPQGTLFGRNTTGGVVHIITRDPSYELSGDVRAGYGNYDAVTASGYLTGGLADDVAADLAVQYSNQGKGWGRNLTTGADTFRMAINNIALRSKLLFEPSDSTTARVAVDYSDVADNAAYQIGPGGAGADGTTNPGRKYVTFSNLEERSKVRSGGASLTIEQDIGDNRLVSITSFRRVNSELALDYIATTQRLVDITNADARSRDWAQEFQLHSAPDASLKWVVGAYYFNMSARFANLIIDSSDVGAGITNGPLGKQTGTSFAGFGQATAEILPATNLTLGLRYTTERQERTFARQPLLPDGQKDHQTFSKLTWRIALDHQFSDDSLGYLSYNRGFKAGGYNIQNPGEAPFKPETLDAFEVGLKNELFDRRLRLNVAAFYYDYKNIQAEIPVPPATVAINADKARIYGAELEFDARPLPDLSIRGGVTWLNGRYRNFPGAIAISATGAVSPIIAADGTNNAQGQHILVNPPWTANLSISYTLSTAIGEFTPLVGISYNDGFYYFADNRLRQPAHTLLNASLAWQLPDERYRIMLWGKNLTNTDYFGSRAEVAGFYDTQRYAPPRTYGVTLQTSF